MTKKTTALSLLAVSGAAAILLTLGPIASGSAEGRQLVGAFCTNPNALPKAGACISLTADGQTAEGYTGSPDRVLTLRPGTYWLTVTDNSAVHNFSLASPDGSAQDITGVTDTPGQVTIKVDLTPGTWSLYCRPHLAFGMFVAIEVGGVGQVG